MVGIKGYLPAGKKSIYQCSDWERELIKTDVVKALEYFKYKRIIKEKECQELTQEPKKWERALVAADVIKALDLLQERKERLKVLTATVARIKRRKTSDS